MIKKLTKSQFSPTHASTKRKITGELKHNAHNEVREGSPVEVQWAVGGYRRMIYGGKDLWNRFVLSLEWKREEVMEEDVIRSKVTKVVNDYVLVDTSLH